MSIAEKARLAKDASKQFAAMTPPQRAHALMMMAKELMNERSCILKSNNADLQAADKGKMAKAMRNRLALSENTISNMAKALKQIALLPDNLGEIMERTECPNGLIINKVRVPFGVIGIIYESRPNVTSDAAGLCIKSGNAVILRGGKEALNSNKAIAHALRKGLQKAGFTPECIQFVEGPGRSEARTMMNLRGQIDLLIPRGGPGLIKAVLEAASIPVIETGAGNCHIYVDASADLAAALSIVVNAKLSNPSVCNAVETLLIHEDVAPQFLPPTADALVSKGVELRGCEKALRFHGSIGLASQQDWSREYLDLILAIKIVPGIDEAIKHISQYGTAHSEAIITEDVEAANRFTQLVDAAAVYVNASTRFTDGGEFGLGAEMGISTQKLHARGPMGIKELTTYKYVIEGKGQIR